MALLYHDPITQLLSMFWDQFVRPRTTEPQLYSTRSHHRRNPNRNDRSPATHLDGNLEEILPNAIVYLPVTIEASWTEVDSITVCVVRSPADRFGQDSAGFYQSVGDR